MLTAELINQLVPAVIFAIFGLAFGFFWLFKNTYTSAAVFSASYFVGSFAFGIEAFFDGPPDGSIGDPRATIFNYLGDLAYTVVATLFVIAVAVRQDCKPPYFWIVSISMGIILAQSWYRWIDPILQNRSQIIAYGSAAIMLLAIPMLFRVGMKKLDLLLCIVIGGFSIFLTANTMVTMTVYGEILTNQNWDKSQFVAGLTFVVTFTTIAIAVTLLASYFQDLVQQLQLQTRTDQMSGLLNRRGFEGQAIELVELSNRLGNPLALIVCDIDDFKNVNDEFGHNAGDEVIVRLSAILQKACRQTDLVARVGGEEFCILLPGANLENAGSIAERARDNLSYTVVEHLPSKKFVSASFGIAEMQAGETYHELFKRADHALYEAKRQGKNRVMIADIHPKKLQAVSGSIFTSVDGALPVDAAVQNKSEG